jgi:hypothetical protein
MQEKIQVKSKFRPIWIGIYLFIQVILISGCSSLDAFQIPDMPMGDNITEPVVEQVSCRVTENGTTLIKYDSDCELSVKVN